MLDFDSIIKEKFTKVINFFKNDIMSLRTGKASPQMLDSVSVEAYGALMKIGELAQISANDPTLLVIKPWDRNMLDPIEKAIKKSDLNLSPVVDSDIIRIAVPPLTEERRKEMVKSLQKKLEEAKVMLRASRADIRKDIEATKSEAGVSEDDVELMLSSLEEDVKSYTQQLEELSAHKEKDLMTV